MMFRAVLCILALGIDTTGAFQAPARSGWTRTTPLMSTNDLYSAGAQTGQKVRQRCHCCPAARCFRRPTSVIPPRPRVHRRVLEVLWARAPDRPPISPKAHHRPLWKCLPSFDVLAGGMEPTAGE